MALKFNVSSKGVISVSWFLIVTGVLTLIIACYVIWRVEETKRAFKEIEIYRNSHDQNFDEVLMKLQELDRKMTTFGTVQTIDGLVFVIFCVFAGGINILSGIAILRGLNWIRSLYLYSEPILIFLLVIIAMIFNGLRAIAIPLIILYIINLITAFVIFIRKTEEC
jgi:hypothetical protein